MNQHPSIIESTPSCPASLSSPLSNTPEVAINWQQSLANVITDPQELLELLGLRPDQVGLHTPGGLDFPLRAPREYVSRIQHGDPQDPLLLQVLPTQQELLAMPGYSKDPLQEQQPNTLPGLIHKYRGRILLTITGACAIHCRYCFRRHFPYQDNNPGQAGWLKIVDYVAADPSINEIIFSGGDPLVAKDSLLAKISQPFLALPQIKRWRIHTRLPIVIPQRVTAELISTLVSPGLPVIVVVHANHPKEIDDKVSQSLKNLKSAGITVLNQAVLLKGINDDPHTLVQLSEKLFESGCLPYYLHVLDKVSGSAHYDVDMNHAREILWDISQQLPGFLVPKLVKEVPGIGSKVPVDLALDNV